MDQAFEILADQFRPMVRAYLRGLVLDRGLAEDLTQETILAAFQSLAGFERGGNFGAWLRGIARNKAKDSRRAAARRPLIVDSRIIEGMEEVYGLFDAPQPSHGKWEDRLHVVRECVGKLSGTLRQTVILTYEQGCSLKETAGALDCSFAAVGQRLSRAREMIRKCVAMKLQQVSS